MILYILAVVVGLAIYAYHSLVYQPKKAIQAYKKAFEDKGYKVLVIPFTLSGSALREKMRKNVN